MESTNEQWSKKFHENIFHLTCLLLVPHFLPLDGTYHKNYAPYWPKYSTQKLSVKVLLFDLNHLFLPCLLQKMFWQIEKPFRWCNTITKQLIISIL